MSQKSALLLNTRASISAVSAVTARRLLHNSLTCLRGTPRGLREIALRQVKRRHELLDEDFADGRRLALGHDQGSSHRSLLLSRYTSDPTTTLVLPLR